MATKNTQKLWVKIMAWALAIVTAGSVATLAVTMLLSGFGAN